MDWNTFYLLGIVVLTVFAKGGSGGPLKGDVSQSSYPENAYKAIDGSRHANYFGTRIDSRHVIPSSCTHTATEDNPWWQLDLKEEYDINHITITNRGDCCSERINGAEIHVGNSLTNNGTDNPRVAVISSIPAGKDKRFHFEIPPSGRYISVNIPGKNRILTLCEVTVFGTRRSGESGGPLKGVVYQSSRPENAYKAIDGIREYKSGPQGSCSSTATEEEPWWRLDLKDEYYINHITITNRGDCCPERIYGAHILIGNSLINNGNDNPAVAVISFIRPGDHESYTFFGVPGRYINLILYGLNRILTLCEVEVFGSRRKGGTVVPLKGVPSQSSYPENAYKAIDGIRDGNYYAWTSFSSCTQTNSELGPWWELDLLKTHKVSSVNIIFADDNPKWLNGAEIRIGNSPAHNGIHNPRCGVVSSTRKNSSFTFDCKGMKGQYITIVIPGREQQLQLCEVEVFGVPLQ